MMKRRRQREEMSHAWGQRILLKAQGIVSWKGSKIVQVFDFEMPCLKCWAY